MLYNIIVRIGHLSKEVYIMLDNIMAIEYEVTICGKDYVRYVVYNKLVITEEEVKKLLRNGMMDYDDRVVVMSEKQFNNLRKV